MAKKATTTKVSTTPKTGNEFDLVELSSFLNEFSEFGGMLDDEKYARIVDWIPTGNYALNALISGDIYKGIPSGRITILSGKSATGKTFLALNTAREAQKQGYFIVWLDSENALNAEQAINNFNIDPSKFRHEIVNTVAEVRTYCKKLTNKLLELKDSKKQIPKILIVIDSIGNLATQKEVNDALSGSEKADMTRAKEIKSLFRVLTADLAKLHIPLIGINHVYDNITSLYGGSVQSGGSGMAFMPSVNVELSKSQMKEGTERIGITVNAKLEKARFAAPYHPIKFQILFNKGMNKFIGLESFMDESTFNILGYGPGRYKVGTSNYSYAGNEFPNSWAIKDGTRNTTRKFVYNSKFFTDERLQKLNEIVNVKLAYHKSNQDEDEILNDDLDEMDSGEDEVDE